MKFTLQPAILCSFFNLSATWGWVANVTPWLVHPAGMTWFPLLQGMVSLRGSMDRCGKYHPHRNLIPRQSTPYQVAVPTKWAWSTQVTLFILRSTLFWNLTQHRMILPYWHFRITYRSSLQEFFLATWPLSKISEERNLISIMAETWTHTHIFFYWHYNPLWVLAFLVILFHSILSLHNFPHPLIPILCTSSSTSSIHLFLGLPLILLPIGFHSNILLGFW